VDLQAGELYGSWSGVVNDELSGFLAPVAECAAAGKKKATRWSPLLWIMLTTAIY
jgi:hypothetical protein